MQIMSPDILIVKDGGGFRLLHGYLRLENALNMAKEILVEVKGEGLVRIVKKSGRIFVNDETLRMPHLAA
jgi:hypothetical protein